MNTAVSRRLGVALGGLLIIAAASAVIAACDDCLGELPVGGEYNGANGGDCVDLPEGNSTYKITPTGGQGSNYTYENDPNNPNDDCFTVPSGGATIERVS